MKKSIKLKCKVSDCENELVYPIEKHTMHCRLCMNRFHPLKQLRLTKRLNQQQMADKLLVGQGTVSKIECRTLEPRMDTLFILRRDFRVNLNYFVDSCIL